MANKWQKIGSATLSKSKKTLNIKIRKEYGKKTYPKYFIMFVDDVDGLISNLRVRPINIYQAVNRVERPPSDKERLIDEHAY